MCVWENHINQRLEPYIYIYIYIYAAWTIDEAIHLYDTYQLDVLYSLICIP